MKRVTFAILMLSMFAALAFAQTSGRLIGTVSSADGLLPGATVTVTDNQTGAERTAISDGNGGFRFDQLSFGTYTVKIVATGFKTSVASDVKIDANRDYTLTRVLEIGQVEEVVNVSAGADIVNASNPELSTTVSPRQVLELPINGRNPLALLNLQAGVNATSSSINGQRSSSVNYTRDGINVQDQFIRTGGFVQDRPTVDDTGEFTVTTQNAGANLGGGGSTQVLLVTPRGGQDFHGGLYIYNRNGAFSANQFENNAAVPLVEKPFLNRNQIGGKLSGPVPVPGFGEGTPMFFKDKGFFFVSYERYILRQTSSQTRRVLLSPFRDGTFRYTDTGGVARTVNVLTGAGLTGPIPGTSGGPLGVDPVIAARVLGVSPSVGNGSILNSNLTQGFVFNQNDNDTRNGFTSRFDVDINDRNNVYFVYKYNDNADDRQTDPGGFDKVPYGTQGGPTDLYILSYRTILGSNFVNEARAAYATSSPFFNQASSFPTDYVIGGLPLGLSNPLPTFQEQGRDTQQTTYQDNATYTAGNHSLRFGIDFNAQRIQSQTNFNKVPIYNISSTANPNTPRLPLALFPGGISTTDRNNADALRYLLGGIVGSGSVAANFVSSAVGPQLGTPDLNAFKYDTYGLYFADSWRATPQLTLNLGIRWDYFTPLTDPNQAFLEPDLQGQTGLNAIQVALTNPNGNYVLIGKNSGVPGQFFKPDKNNFGPVLGFAWTPSFSGAMGTLLGKEGQTVIRGGFRMGYINDEYVRSADNAAGGNAGLSSTVRATQNGSVNLNARFNALPGFVLPPFSGTPISFATGNANAGNFFNTVFAIDPDLQTQQNMEYSFGFQREIGWDTAIEIRYVGGRSNSLVRGYDFNQVDIRSNGFAQDFINARNNCRIQGATVANPNPFDPLLSCTDARNIGLPGQVDLPVFGQLPFGSFLNNGTVVGQIINGSPGELAVIYITNGLDQVNGVGVNFRANRNAGVVDLLANEGAYRYNAVQMEIRRRFTQGLYFQANYTFQKTLATVLSDAQARFDPYLDNENKGVEYSRPDYDRAHTFNFNTIYELPFGKGKRFLNEGGLVDKLFGGIQFTSIVNVSSGVPISIKDINGTLNRLGRSNRNTANSSLSTSEIQNLIGIFHQNGRVYFINPSVIAPDGSATGGNVQATNTGAFAGQKFFRVQPGQIGTLPRAFINGPWYFNWDAGLIKNINIKEGMRLQLRAEAFNVLNNVNFTPGENSSIFDIDSSTFGQIPLSNNFGSRVMQFAVRFEF